MSKLREIHIWCVSLFILVIFRFISGNLFTEGTLVSLMLYGLVFYRWVVPFIFGKDMELIGYSDIFKKGRDDPMRYLLLGVGIFSYFGALLAPLTLNAT